MPHIQRHCPLRLLSPMLKVLEFEWDKAIANHSVQSGTGFIITFRDPRYSAEEGGYHPVEFAIDGAGKVLSITDFSYAGILPFAKLEKELDFDFRAGIFRQMGVDYPIAKGRELFQIFQQNFCTYYSSRVFEVTVTPL